MKIDSIKNCTACPGWTASASVYRWRPGYVTMHVYDDLGFSAGEKRIEKGEFRINETLLYYLLECYQARQSQETYYKSIIQGGRGDE